MARSAFRTILTGAAAGAVGTLVMDSVWFKRYRADGGEDGFAGWEFATGAEGFDDAGAPAKVGQKLANAVGVTIPEEHAGLTTDLVHWQTGLGWGAAHAVLHGAAGRAGAIGWAPAGLATGLVAWLASYGVLAPLGIYQPPWEYDGNTLWKDLTAHIAFGLGTSVAFRLLDGDHE